MKTILTLLAGALIGAAVAQTANVTSNSTASPAAANSTTTPPAPAAARARGANRGGSNVHPVSTNINDRLTKSPRHVDNVKIKQGDREIDASIYYPAAKDKVMAVVLIHEIYGYSDWVKAAGDQLAENGYIAIVPDLLSGQGPNKGGTTDLPENQVGGAINRLPAAQITADLNAVVDYAKTIPSCNGNVAVAGFCWGGGQSFRFATNNKDLKAAFVFYGPPPPAADMANINCPIYGFYGGMDNRISATIPQATADMKAAGKTYEPVVYEGAAHGFMRAGQMDDTSPANKKAAEDGWKRWLEILAKINAPDSKPAAAASPAAQPAN